MQNTEYKIENLRDKKDLEILATEYSKLYNNSVLQEKWTPELAEKLFEYFYNLNSRLFCVAYCGDRPIGAIMSVVKPWWDGMHLEDTEIFVAKDYQRKGIGTDLYKYHYKIAIEEFGATIMEAHTYADKSGYPLNWYKKLGFEVIEDWKVINGNIKDILERMEKDDRNL